MTNRKIAHIISHTHWDREWYLPYEKHHVRLIRLMDTLLDLLATDPEFKSFHLDGQTIILEDYLQVRPDRKPLLQRLVSEGKLHIGPWYVLQDEFLTSSEANIRNLLTGLRDAKEYGAVCHIGYFPDSFGNMGQAPQILRQAGIDNAVFGRGVKPTGFNNSTEPGDFESPFSEMIWESPDGSRVVGILFANWYHNGMQIPVDPERARSYWDTKMAKAESFASTPHLLFMNGCDHQPVQQNLSQALRTASALYPDMEFIHSNFPDYIRAVKEAVAPEWAIVRGELRSQRTNGWTTLVNTASSRVYIKQANVRCQALLEKAAEPLAAAAYALGAPYPHHLLNYAWKTLMQNHPHDSICGCSVDEVHREMMIRFAKSAHVAEEIIEEGAAYIASRINFEIFADIAEAASPIVVFNTAGWLRDGMVTATVDIMRILIDGTKREDAIAKLTSLEASNGMLVDPDGNRVECAVKDLGVQFHYELPEETFRERYFVRRIELTFYAEHVPSLGYKTYAWIPQETPHLPLPAEVSSPLKAGERTMENEWLKVEIAPDGSLSVTVKPSGRSFSGLCVYEDTGDLGNEYIYKQPDGEAALTTKGMQAAIRCVESNGMRIVFEIVHDWHVPRGMDEKAKQEMAQLVSPRVRQGGRTEETVPLTLTTRVTLEKNGKAVLVRASFVNEAENHRLRVLFPTDLDTAVHSADSIFEVARRDTVPAPEWTNPSNCQHQQAFVSVSGDCTGLTVANLGLHEYEVLRDGRSTIAVTMLRAVGELGDWGLFPTPEAQCKGPHTVEFAIIPHSGDGIESGAFVQAYQYQTPWTVRTAALRGGGSLPPKHSFFAWSAAQMALSSFKVSEASGDIVSRWFNMSLKPASTRFSIGFNVLEAYRSNVLEERIGYLSHYEQASFVVESGPAEIVTVAVTPC